MAYKKLPFIPAHLFYFKDDEEDKPIYVPIKTLNHFFACNLCKGYIIDATTITECLHTFCKSCIVKYFLSEKDKCAIKISLSSSPEVCCPICRIKVSDTMPLNSLQYDRTFQDLINKLLPSVIENENTRQLDFYEKHEDILNRDDIPESDRKFVEKFKKYKLKDISNHEDTLKNIIQNNDENDYMEDDVPLISFRIIGDLSKDVLRNTQNMLNDSKSNNFVKYIRCPDKATISNLLQMLEKYIFDTERISLYLEDVKLSTKHTIKQVAIMATLLLEEETLDQDFERKPQVNDDYPYNIFTLRIRIQ